MSQDEPQGPPRKGVLRDYFETIVVCVIFVIFSRAFVFQQSKIPTGSMENTLLVGDYIMVNRFAYAPTATALERALLPIRDVERGDVIVFKFPQDPDTDFIKRVVGLPGDRIEMRNGIVFINGEVYDEPYVIPSHRDPRPYPPPGQLPTIVPEGSYFVMGDHRNDSRDSREWRFVRKELIRGRAFIIWFSFPEERNEYQKRGMDWAKTFLSKIVRLIPESRWSRCFTIIR